jgi:hypothetical protein
VAYTGTFQKIKETLQKLACTILHKLDPKNGKREALLYTLIPFTAVNL